MEYLKILHEDSNLAADFDALFDFFLLVMVQAVNIIN